jgi:hypothetical protein
MVISVIAAFPAKRLNIALILISFGLNLREIMLRLTRSEKCRNRSSSHYMKEKVR